MCHFFKVEAYSNVSLQKKIKQAYEQDACFIVMRNNIVLYYDYLLEVI